MRKIKCAGKPESHFFDADRFHICPICGAPPADTAEGNNNMASPVGTDIPPTVLLYDVENRPIPWDTPSEPANTSHSQNAAEPKVETAIPVEPQRNTPAVDKPMRSSAVSPVGWLVGIEGESWGKTFECRVGRNRIGNAPAMDIPLTNGSTDSKDAFAVLIYEPKRRKFYIESGNSAGKIYLNGERVYTHAELQAYDKLRFGESTLLLIPLCGERFAWEDYLNKEQEQNGKM